MIKTLLFFAVVLLYIIYNPYIDSTKDAVILWYDKGINSTERGYIILYKKK